MVFFAITRTGYNELVAVLGSVPSPLWVNAGVLASEEVTDLESRGISVTSFTVDVTSSFDRYATALDTIWQHHQHEKLWAEYFAEP